MSQLGYERYLGPVYTPNPVNRQHRLAKPLAGWFHPINNLVGGQYWWDIFANHQATYSFSSTSNGWRGSAHPGLYSEVLFNGSPKFLAGDVLGVSTAEPFGLMVIFKGGINNSSFMALCGKGYLASVSGHGLYLNNGVPAYQVRNGATVSLVSGSANLFDNKYHQLIGTRINGTTTLYVDGKSVGTDSTSGVVANDTSAFAIGSQSGGTFVWNGRISSVAAFNGVVSAADAREWYREWQLGFPGLLNRKPRKASFQAPPATVYDETSGGGVIVSGQELDQATFTPDISGGALTSGTVGGFFDETGNGGCTISGSASIDFESFEVHTCGCNNFFIRGTGGTKCSGSALDTSPTMPVAQHGGIVTRGNCYVSIINKLFDECIADYELQENDGLYIDLAGGDPGIGGDDAGDTSTIPTQTDDGIRCSFAQAFLGRQLITLPLDPLGTLTPCTVEGWVKISSDFIARSFFSRGSTDWNFQFGHSFLRQLTASIVVDGETPTTYKVTGATRLERDRWYYVAAVYDPDGMLLSVYVDGVLDKSISIPRSALLMPLGNSYLGEWNSGSWFEGEMEEFSIWNVAASASALAAQKAMYCDPSFFSESGAESPTG